MSEKIDIEQVDGIGALESLTTTDKSNLVNAINEVNGNIPDVSNFLEKDTANIVTQDFEITNGSAKIKLMNYIALRGEVEGVSYIDLGTDEGVAVSYVIDGSYYFDAHIGGIRGNDGANWSLDNYSVTSRMRMPETGNTERVLTTGTKIGSTTYYANTQGIIELPEYPSNFLVKDASNSVTQDFAITNDWGVLKVGEYGSIYGELPGISYIDLGTDDGFAVYYYTEFGQHFEAFTGGIAGTVNNNKDWYLINSNDVQSRMTMPETGSSSRVLSIGAKVGENTYYANNQGVIELTGYSANFLEKDTSNVVTQDFNITDGIRIIRTGEYSAIRGEISGYSFVELGSDDGVAVSYFMNDGNRFEAYTGGIYGRHGGENWGLVNNNGVQSQMIMPDTGDAERILTTGAKIGSNTYYANNQGIVELPDYPSVSGFVPYTGATSDLELGSKNLVLNGGSIYSSVSTGGTGSRLFTNVFNTYMGTSAATGILSLKFPMNTASGTMFDVTIKLYGYQNKYIGEYRVAFYKYTSTTIHASAGPRAYVIGSNLPTNVVRVGIEGSNVCINLGDTNTVWSAYLSLSIDRLESKYTGFNQDYSKGWSASYITDTSSYLSLVNIPTDVIANQNWVNQQIGSISIPTVNNGQLTLSTGTGLSGSANFTANQSGNSSFSVSVANTHKLPTVTEWSNTLKKNESNTVTEDFEITNSYATVKLNDYGAIHGKINGLNEIQLGGNAGFAVKYSTNNGGSFEAYLHGISGIVNGKYWSIENDNEVVSRMTMPETGITTRVLTTGAKVGATTYYANNQGVINLPDITPPSVHTTVKAYMPGEVFNNDTVHCNASKTIVYLSTTFAGPLNIDIDPELQDGAWLIVIHTYIGSGSGLFNINGEFINHTGQLVSTYQGSQGKTYRFVYVKDYERFALVDVGQM